MNKQRISQLMDYLYEEMDTGERRSFEQRVQQDPELAAELESLSSVRKHLSALNDVEPEKKPDMEDFGRGIPVARRALHSWIKPLLAIAASIALVFVTGYVTQFHLQLNGRGLYIGFSSPPSTGQGVDNRATADHAVSMIQTLQRETTQITEKLTALQSQVQLLNNTSADGSNDPQRLIEQVENSYRAGLEELYHYIDTHNLQQRAYVRDVITEYANYLQNQREEDLLAVGQVIGTIQQRQAMQNNAADNLVADIVPSTTFE